MSKPKGNRGPSVIVRQHYIPAAYLSRFSYDKFPQRRTRRVFALQRGKARPVYAKAENFGIAKNIYTLDNPSILSRGAEEDPYAIERLWQGIEKGLGGALGELSDPTRKTISAHTWARCLVPFIASLLVRGPSFNNEYESRPSLQMIETSLLSDGQKGIITPDNTNMSRLLELQRLLAPVAASRLIVLHSAGDDPIITNDLGYAYFYCPLTREPGYVIPLDPSTALGVIPGETNIACEGRWPGSWETEVHHHQLQPNVQGGLNKALAQAAQNFIFGPTLRSVTRWTSAMSVPGQLPRLHYFTRFTPKTRRRNEFLWHRLISAISLRPGDARVGEFRRGYEDAELAEGWLPVIFIPTERSSEQVSLFLMPPRIIIHMPDDLVSQRMFMDRTVARDGGVHNVWAPLPTVKTNDLGTRSDAKIRAVMTDAVHTPRMDHANCS